MDAFGAGISNRVTRRSGMLERLLSDVQPSNRRRGPMAKDINKAVREVCLWFPEAAEVISHGSPDFRVRGKTFATYVVNHHGDQRIALWLNAPAGAQELYTRAEPKHFFVPPYVGPRGWLGVQLDKGISWKRVAKLVREAYEKVAPPSACSNARQDDRDRAADRNGSRDAVRPDVLEARAKRAQDDARRLPLAAGDF